MKLVRIHFRPTEVAHNRGHGVPLMCTTSPRAEFSFFFCRIDCALKSLLGAISATNSTEHPLGVGRLIFLSSPECCFAAKLDRPI